jgi:hypothetical protein
MSESLVEPFEVRESVPEFLTTIAVGKKEGATLPPVLQDEGSHYFLLVQWEDLRHIKIISRCIGESPATRR